MVKVCVEKRVAESKHYFQTAKVYGIGDGTWFRKITLARSEIMKREDLTNCLGDLGIALSELSKIDEGECSLDTWSHVCNSIEYLNSVYEDLKDIKAESKSFNPHSADCELRKE